MHVTHALFVTHGLMRLLCSTYCDVFPPPPTPLPPPHYKTSYNNAACSVLLSVKYKRTCCGQPIVFQDQLLVWILMQFTKSHWLLFHHIFVCQKLRKSVASEPFQFKKKKMAWQFSASGSINCVWWFHYFHQQIGFHYKQKTKKTHLVSRLWCLLK